MTTIASIDIRMKQLSLEQKKGQLLEWNAFQLSESVLKYLNFRWQTERTDVYKYKNLIAIFELYHKRSYK